MGSLEGDNLSVIVDSGLAVPGNYNYNRDISSSRSIL